MFFLKVTRLSFGFAMFGGVGAASPDATETEKYIMSPLPLSLPPSICVVAVPHLQSIEAVSHVLKHDHHV